MCLERDLRTLLLKISVSDSLLSPNPPGQLSYQPLTYGNVINEYQNDSGDLRGVAGGDGELGCLCGKAGTSHLCDGSAHSSGCVVNAMAAV